MKLSKNFSLSELTKSQTASRKGINNDPSAEHLENMKALAENVLQKVRDHFGPTVVNSGYRSPALNTAIGGASSSQHCKGEAADIEVIGVSTKELAEWISENLEYDQLILEFYNPADTNSGWVHVSYKENKNRKQNLTAVKENGKTVYKVGLL